MAINNQENCTHDCSTCRAKCSQRKEPGPMFEAPNANSKIGKVIAVVSGKGGVGKSMVTSLLAVEMRRRGYETAVLDADITGPSIPKAFGLKPENVNASSEGIYPVKTKTGIKVMSVNLLLDDETSPVVWRGPIISGTVKQFWSDVIWGDIDIMFIDMPPGTGDVTLTTYQSLPIDGIIIVTSPQELVSVIVEKAINMANLMNVPTLGIIENMSYVLCPGCGEKIEIFGKSRADAIAEKFGFPVLGRLPLDPKLASMCDLGTVELAPNGLLSAAADVIELN